MKEAEAYSLGLIEERIFGAVENNKVLEPGDFCPVRIGWFTVSNVPGRKLPIAKGLDL
jgi:hypothetical protein